jgi:hypothetical protein
MPVAFHPEHRAFQQCLGGALTLAALLVGGCQTDGPAAEDDQGPSLRAVVEGDAETTVLCGSGLFVSLAGDNLVFVGEETPALVATDATGTSVEAEVMPLSVQVDCTPLDEVDDGFVCDQVFARLPLAASDAPYVSELTLTNPTVDGLSGSASLALTIVPAPTLAAVSDPVVWVPESGREVVLRGNGFLAVDTGSGETLPRVTHGEPPIQPLEVVDVGGCEALDLPGTASARICSEVTVRLSPQGPDAQGWLELTVAHPDPLGCQTGDVNGPRITPFPGPDHEFLLLGPPSVCDARTVRLDGGPMYEVDGQPPMVTVGGVAAELALDGCEGGGDVRPCSGGTITLPPDLDLLGPVDVVFTHPPPLVRPVSASLFLESPPVIEAAVPAQVSASLTQQVVLQTTGFSGYADPTVTMVDGSGDTVVLAVDVPQQTLDGDPNCEQLTLLVPEGRRCLEVEVTVPAEALGAAYLPSLTLANDPAVGCSGTESSVLTITP